MPAPTARRLMAVGLTLVAAACGTGSASDGPDTQEDDLRRCRRLGTGCIDAGALSSGPDAGAVAADAAAAGPDAGGANPDAGPFPPADCATAPLRTTGAVYYVCDCQAGADPACVAGDDANPGTSPSSPKQSLAAARSQFNSMPAGGTVALCRGGAWSGNFSVLGNANCRSTDESTYCDLRDYVPAWGTAATPKPLINASGNGITMWGDAGAAAGFRFWNLDLRWPPSARADSTLIPTAFFILGTQNDIDICNVSITNPRIGIQQDSSVNRMRTRNSTLRMCGGQGILGAGNGTVIDANTFIDNGDQSITGSPGQAHTIYAVCGNPFNNTSLCTGIRITNNYIYTGPDSLAADAYGSCRGMMLALRGHTDGAVIANNYLESSGPFGCGSILVGFSGEDARHINTTVTRNRIKVRNQVDDPAYPNAGMARSDIAINTGEYVKVTDNIVWAGRNTRPIESPESTRSDSPVLGTIIRNNTIYTTASLSSPSAGIRVGWNSSFLDFVVENNAVYVPQGTACLRADGLMLSGHPLTYTTWPDAAANSAGNYCMQGGDPKALWVDPDSGDFRPVVGGPLIGLGNSTYYSPTAVGSVAWNPGDPGVARALPIDIGAMVH